MDAMHTSVSYLFLVSHPGMLHDPDIVIVLALLADGPDFVGSERRVKPEGPT
jgi:hypothetical protein